MALSGQKCHRGPREHLGLSRGSLQHCPLGVVPAPTLRLLLHPVQTGGDTEGPPERQASRGCPVFGTSSSLLLGDSPTHPHEHRKDIDCFIELFVRRRLPLSAVPCQQGASRAPAGAPGRFPAVMLGAAFVLLSKAAAKAKLAAGKVRSGQGKPATCCRKMAGTKAFPPAAVADGTGK